jgi:protein CMS1
MAPSKRPGDDFEDDFVPDDLVALSDDGGDIVYESLSASGDEEPVNVASTSTLPSITPEDAKRAKKRKRRQKEKEAKAKVNSICCV